jgi:RNA polymerase sigma factor (sigma-70 family)
MKEWKQDKKLKNKCLLSRSSAINNQMTDMGDMELLRNYDRQSSEDAFAELVHRHINLVYSVALRHVSNTAQAEEITQVVFVILARKASSLRPDTILEGWLYETTRLTALSFLRGERRRQFREQEAYMQSTLDESEEASIWNQMSPLLDEAMSRLGKKDRDALVLRFFKGMNLDAVAGAMNTTEAAAQSRVHRATEKLRRFFTKRGVIVSAAILTASISSNSIQAAPVALAKSVTAMAIVKGSAATASTLTLIKGTLKIMAWTKMKTGIVAAAILVLATGTTTIVVKKMEHKHVNSTDAAIQKFVQTPGGAISMEALNFIGSLKHKGQLPGILSNTPAGTEIPWISFDHPGGTAHYLNTNLTFPVTLTLTVHANDANDRYHYTVAKAAKTGEWQLQKAWRTDTNGVILNEYPVP